MLVKVREVAKRSEGMAHLGGLPRPTPIIYRSIMIAQWDTTSHPTCTHTLLSFRPFTPKLSPPLARQSIPVLIGAAAQLLYTAGQEPALRVSEEAS
jgi:hypothetical protein